MDRTESCLVLRLQGPLQSWGTESRFGYCKTNTMPSRSAIAGMLCAALGLNRGSDEEHTFLEKEFPGLLMESFAVSTTLSTESGMLKNLLESSSPEDLFLDSVASAACRPTRPPVPIRRMEDYHTALGTISAKEYKDSGKAVVTRRQYLDDALFFVLLGGNEGIIGKLSRAVQDPVWGVWLGRKACIPSAPIFAGVFSTIQEAELFVQKGKTVFCWEKDCSDFANRTDVISDIPLTFESTNRKFAMRGVHREWGPKDSN